MLPTADPNEEFGPQVINDDEDIDESGDILQREISTVSWDDSLDQIANDESEFEEGETILAEELQTTSIEEDSPSKTKRKIPKSK